MSVNVTKARENLYELTDKVIKNNETITINTRCGDALLISKENYDSLVETLFLSSDPEYKKSLIDGMKTPIEECLNEEEIDW